MFSLGKLLIFVGLFLVGVGVVMLFMDKLPFNFGRLPGDFFVEKGNFSFYFPLTSSILLSVIFSLLLYLFGKFLR